MKSPSRIRKLIVTLSERSEFWLVLIVAFGLPIWNSFAGMFARRGFVPNDRGRLVNCAIQLAILVLIAWVGRIRGWSIRQLGLHPSWRLTAMGVLLFPAMVIIPLTVSTGIHKLASTPLSHTHGVAPGLSLVAILATSIINPLFEETLVCGYIIQRLAKKGVVVAVTFSACVRFLCHTYLGLSSVGPLVVGFMFGYIFWRYRELWPLIVAHGLIDLLALLLLAGKI